MVDQGSSQTLEGEATDKGGDCNRKTFVLLCVFLRGEEDNDILCSKAAGNNWAIYRVGYCR